MPQLSIVIPIYNAAPYLQQCLESILEQTYTDYEVLLIDDGSTDDSADVCRAYAVRDERLHYLHKENGGVSSARNMGIRHAVGQFVCFVDADDWLQPDMLSTVMQTPAEMADITFYGANKVQDGVVTETIIFPDAFYEKRNPIEQAIYQLRYAGERDVFGWTWDKVMRTDVIRSHGIMFREDVSFREDELFAFEYCRYIKSLRVIGKALYNYRVLSTGLTNAGMKRTDYLPSSIALEDSLKYYSHPALRENMLSSITAYRAIDIYKSEGFCIREKLSDYIQLTRRLPQSGKYCKVNNLTRYLRVGLWAGYLYCLVRKL